MMREIYAGKKDGSRNGSERSTTGIMGTESTGEEILSFLHFKLFDCQTGVIYLE